MGATNRKLTETCEQENCSNASKALWIDGTEVVLDSWNIWFLPNNLPCVNHNPDITKISDFHCNKAKPYICQLDCNQLYTEPDTDCQPNDYEKGFDGKFYKVSDTQMNYWDAIEHCGSEGATLAMIKASGSLDSIKYSLSNHAFEYDSYIGVINPTTTKCYNASCTSTLIHIDGSAFDEVEFEFDSHFNRPCATLSYTNTSSNGYRVIHYS